MPKNTTVQIHVALERIARMLRAADYNAEMNPAQWQALRYISRCNRFSNSQQALGRYLAATKGTVSQTLASLVVKGLIRKAPRPGGGQSLSLTERGAAALRADPARALFEKLDAFSPEERKALLNDLDVMILASLSGEDEEAGFGTCRSCAHFSAAGDGRKKKGRCGRFGERLKKKETRELCAYFVWRGYEEA